jgi:RNA polymerase sigma-70 factor (ECF subfamily)
VAESDADLVGRAVAGAQDAFRTLADRFTPPAFNLILRLVRDRGVAEELTQDALMKAFRGLRTFDPALKLAPWMLRIAHNTAIDYLRRHRPELVSITEDPERPGAHPVLVDERERTPFEQAQLADLRTALDWALAQLRPDYRRLVVMRYQEDQSYEDISAALDLPLGTVKSHLHRARQAMAALLDEAGWAPSEAGDVKPGPPSAT